MPETVNVDTCALVNLITPIAARLKHLVHFTLHKSVAREIVTLSDDPCPEKQEVGLQAALALVRLQALPHITVTCDPREPSTAITDDDLVFWSEHDQVPLLTSDVALQERASRRGIQVLRTQHLEQDLRPLLPELLAAFCNWEEIAEGDILKLRIVKAGKEAGQGVAYLRDRRKVVVKNAAAYLGQHIEVRITCVLDQPFAQQTLFAEPVIGTARE